MKTIITLALATLAKRMACPLLLLTAGLVFVQPCEGQSGTWADTGDLNDQRQSHTATLLLDGRVLVVGGNGLSGPLASAELYDPVTETWSLTQQHPSTKRRFHTATLLRNGKVLVAGGEDTANMGLKSAELYDPETDTWSDASPLSTGRFQHTATVLSDGTVLVAGGVITSGSSATAPAALYDPETDTWSDPDDLKVGRSSHTAMLLLDHRVLVFGGVGSSGLLASWELYDPVTETWSLTQQPPPPPPPHAAFTRRPCSTTAWRWSLGDLH
jgi:N-acetylneuraminic acid mutarotase